MRRYPAVWMAFLFSVYLSPLGAEALSPQAVNWYNQARESLGTGRLQEAEYQAHQALTFDSYDPLLHILLGQVYHRQGLVEKAIGAYQRAAELDAKDASIYYTLATLYEQQQAYDAARKHYEISLQKNPAFDYAKGRLARILGFEGKYAEANALYEAYLQNNPKDTEAHVQVARFAVSLEDPKKAIAHLLYVQQQAPDAFSEEALLARAYLMNKMPEAAKNVLDMARAKGRYSTEVADLSARAYEALGDVAPAIQELERAVATSPQEPNYLYRLASLYHQQGKGPVALQYLNRYLEQKPTDAAARLVYVGWLNAAARYGEANQEAEALLAKTLPLSQAQQQNLLQEMAFSALKTQQFSRAIGLYEDAKQKAPQGLAPTVQQSLAVAYFQNGNYPAALQEFEALLRREDLSSENRSLVQKDLYQLYLKRAKGAFEEGLIQQGQQALAQARNYAQSPSEKEALQLEEGAMFFQQGKTTEAISAYEAALQQFPQNLEARLNLAKLFEEQAPEKALALVKGIEADPNVAPAFRAMAQRIQAASALKQGDTQEALQHLEALQTLAKQGETSAMTPEAYLQLGVIYQQQKRIEDAQKAYEAALQQDPAYSLAAYNLGSLYFEQRNYSKAKDAYLQALKGDAPVSEALYAMGILEERERNYDAAYDYLNRYVKSPDNPNFVEKAQSRLAGLLPKLKQTVLPQPASKTPAQTQNQPPVDLGRIEVRSPALTAPANSQQGRISL